MDNIRIPVPSVGFHPPVYLCRRAVLPFEPDGRLDKPFWEKAEFTEAFTDIEGAHMPLPRFVTRAKIMWDDENLYVGAQLDGNEIWGNVTRRDDVIFRDNDFEIFIDPDSDTRQYYEFEMNVLNTVWDLFLPCAYRDGGNAVVGYDIHGLRSAVSVCGEINTPSPLNKSWSVEVAIPFAAITECLPDKRPPKAGEYYRMNFSRVQWKVSETDGCYRKLTDPEGNPLPEDNWVWSPTGVINIHYPELWGFVFFTEEGRQDGSFQIPEDERRKWELRKLYYAQNIHMDTYGTWCTSLDILRDILRESSPCEENRRLRPLDYTLETTSHTYEISCPSAEEGRRILLLSDGRIMTEKPDITPSCLPVL